MPREEYLESLLRHTIDLWDEYERKGTWNEELECAILFNAQGLLHETMKEEEILDQAMIFNAQVLRPRLLREMLKAARRK